MIDRSRLNGLLDRGAPLTVLRAPAGYGKSMLLRQWLAGRPVGQLVVRMDGHAVIGEEPLSWDTFWAHLADAVRARGLAPAGGPYSGDRGWVHDALTSAGTPVILVADDFDLLPVGADQALMDIQQSTPGLRIIVALRGCRHFSETAYPAPDFVAISGSDLRFTEEETVTLFRALEVQLPAAAVSVIHRRIGGWPAVTRSVAQAARALAPDRDLDAAVTGIVMRFLDNQLAPQADPGRRQLLSRLALADEITVALAEALGGDGAPDTLDRLHREGVLSVRMRSGEPVYTLPAVARETLAARFEADAPAAARRVHTDLSEHFQQHDRPAPALLHAIRAKDWLRARRILELSWGPLMMQHRSVLHQALTCMPLKIMRGSNTAMAVRNMLLDTPDGVLPPLDCSLPDTQDELLEAGRSARAAEWLAEGLAVMVAHRLRRDFRRACGLADRLDTVLSSARAFSTAAVINRIPATLLQMGITRLTAGDIGQAIDQLHRAHLAQLHSRHPDGRYVLTDAAAKLALSHALRGEIGHAEHWLARHGVASTPPAWYSPMISSSVEAARALIATDRMDAVRASEAIGALDRAIVEGPVYERLPQREPWLDLYLITHARHALLWDDPLSVLRRIEQTHALRGGPGRDAPVDAMLLAAQAELLLAVGRGDQARAALDVVGGHPSLSVPRARLALLTGQVDLALQEVAAAVLDTAVTTRDHLQLQLIHAVARHRLGEGATAERILRSATLHALGIGSLYAFLTVPRNELRAIAERVPESAALLDSQTLSALPDVFPPKVTVVELTGRELEILAHLAHGRTGTQIAAQLFISHNTWKFHSRNLYRKLGATSRQEALSQARMWGLIPIDRELSRPGR